MAHTFTRNSTFLFLSFLGKRIEFNFDMVHRANLHLVSGVDALIAENGAAGKSAK